MHKHTENKVFSLGVGKTMEICETCVWDYIKSLIELERYMPSWKECETDELLFAIGESQTRENVVHMNIARKKL